MMDCNAFEDSNAFEKAVGFVEGTKKVRFVGVHLFRSGRLLWNYPSDAVTLIVGGTDVNENVNSPEKLHVMRKVCRFFCCLVVLTFAAAS